MMTSSNMKYTILSILFAFAALTSCIDDDLICVEDTEVPEDITNGYSLNFTVTLDKMGGTRSIEGLGNPMEAMEDYVDLEKFRVLFFNKDDKFLFESKSRWVKRLTPTTDDYTRWFVSVPVFSYGNDAEENWKWKEIRETLTTEKFKIAILANRPEMDMAVEFDEIEQREEWFDNTGPHWGVNDAVGGTEVKDVFDLHHSQYDPIYTYKSYSDEKSYPNNPYYEFVTGKGTHTGYKGDTPGTYDVRTMSSTSSWVTWDKAIETDNGEEGDKRKTGTVRYFRTPDENYPIPMYGIQQFEPLTDWKEGTTYNLTRKGDVTDKPISLLRSVVKLELIIPKTTYKEMEYVYIIYPNIYARCEPMNVWKPTDELWGESHNNGVCSDWDHIAAYGPISRSTDPASTGVKEYQNRMLWFYGAWRNKWLFEAGNGFDSESRFDELAAEGFGEDTYPQIYNSCIQRNTAVAYDIEKNNFDTDDYFRYIVYLGERNINDPSKLNALGNSSSGGPTISYWRFKFNNGKAYNIPLTDLRNFSNLDDIIDNVESTDSQGRPTTNDTDKMHKYENEVQDMNSDWPKPWPLIRNHVYRITVTTKDKMSYYWNFGEIGFGTQNDMTNATNWINPRGVEINKPLSYDDLNQNTNNVNQDVKIKWWESDNLSTAPTLNGKFETGTYKIDGKNPIMIGSGVTTTLTVPEEKIIEELTLRSYVNKTLKDEIPINYPTKGTSGITINTPSNDPKVSITTWNNQTGYKFDTNYSSTNNIQLSNGERGFKAGDKITVSGCYSHDTSVGTLVLNTGNETYSFDLINLKKTTTFQEKSYTLTQDCDYVYLGRAGGTGVLAKTIKVTCPEAVKPIYYWSNVDGVTYNYEEKGMNAFVGQEGYYDTYRFPVGKNSVSFTNSASGEEVGFIALVKTANADGTPDYWGLLNSPNNAELKADDKVINEFRGLKFTGGTIRVYDRKDDEDKDKFCLIGNTTITFPSLSEDYTITVKGRAKGSTTPSIEPVTSTTSGQHTFDNNESTFTWTVNANATVQLQLANNNEGVYIYEAKVEPQSGNSIRATRAADGGLNFKIKSEDLHSKSIRFD